MEPAHAILTSSAVYLIIVIFIKACCSSSTGAGELGEVRRGSRKKEKRVGAKQPHAICATFLQHTCRNVLYNQRGCTVCYKMLSA
jgi:hypothetical protein